MTIVINLGQILAILAVAVIAWAAVLMLWRFIIAIVDRPVAAAPAVGLLLAAFAVFWFWW